MRQPLSIVVAALALSGPLQAAEPKTFTVKNDNAHVGSLIRTDRLTLSVPPNKPYAELTEAQKASVRADYQGLQPGDEPPYPLNGPGDMLNAIIEAQFKLQVEGELDLVAKISPEGKVSSVSLIKSPDPKLTKFAASVVALQKFKPAMCQGSPCEMDYPVRLTMKLER